MKIKLSDHFGYGRLLRFTLPSIAMMIFTSVYSIVDGIFVSNFVGKTPFAAVNFVFPVLMIVGALGFMMGTGGSAIVAKTMGEGKMDKARSLFSLIVWVTIIGGIIITVIGFVLLRPVCRLLGTEGEMLDYCVLYGRILLITNPFFLLQYEFQSFFITAEKPHMGLVVSVAAGLTNIVLDALFTAVLSWGLAGAAVATSMSQLIGGAFPLYYFSRRKTEPLRLVKPEWDGRALLRTCTNGSSELMSNVSMSLVSMLYNVQLMKYSGEDGVAAYGVLMYVNMIFLAAFIGYSTGSAPIVSFNFGARNNTELKGLFKKSLVIIGISSVAMLAMGELLAAPLSAIFVSYDDALMSMTVRAFRIYSLSFLCSGISIYGSSFFTALNDGLTSALISFLRTLVFQVAAVLLLPLILGLDGIWYSIVVAEVMALALTTAFLLAYRKKYRY